MRNWGPFDGQFVLQGRYKQSSVRLRAEKLQETRPAAPVKHTRPTQAQVPNQVRPQHELGQRA